MKREVIVESVAVTEDSLQLSFFVMPEDVRSDGHVVVSRLVSVSFEAPEGLGAKALDLRTAIVGLVEEILEELPDLPVYDPPATEPLPLLGYGGDEDEDEDVGMGDGR